ncbi:hypothetical protein D0Z07_8338 [Hyphodiscus hymeniophilus]|uniref:Uncharacterized protein n=1 Tax=Hyphodiscus hymeniophilus TaxID=353542 RepID=A0A9P6SLI7_9HELO|nr:hypothetical protein D0Z07_8338 [Hyphodiscus hymeniophilus]
MAPTEISLQSVSPRTNRSHSISSDRPSLTGYGGLLSPPMSSSPEPAFIAASAASQIVTNDHDSQADTWLDQHGIEPSGETAMVAPLALKLVNRFLDQLLFNFLSISRSTSLASLRPAVAEVLKPKLAKEAISGADQELHEYLGGGEDEELMAFHNGLEPTGDWDLELVWKRTRLRCMVYSSLGDMEEEDEDLYTEQEQLDGPPGSNNRFSNNPGVVSPAVAIFLTSILEFMGEQVLVVAGQAAYHRLRARHERQDRDGTSTYSEIAERVVVEESDMERVALDRTLGRLWRGWKKRIRSPNTSMSMTHSFSRESLRSQAQASRSASIAPEDNIKEILQRPSIDAALATHEYAAAVPLPMSDDDIREIEIPGLAKQVGDEEDDEEKEELIPQKQRPKSLMIFTSHLSDQLLTPTSSQPQTPIFLASSGRKRSHSLPSPVQSIFTSPIAKRAKSGIVETNDDHEMEDEPARKEVSNNKAVTKAEEQHSEDLDMAEVPVMGEASDERVAAKTEGTQFEESDQIKDLSQGSKSMIAEVIASAATIGATAVAGIAAAVNGQAPQTDVDYKEEIDAEEEFIEEPQILTSSRVSIGGPLTPDESRAPSRQGSVRANSVHSLRLIDVASPKSPSRSRHGSVDAADYVGGRPTIGSRPNSIHSMLDGPTPRMASPVSRGPTSSPLVRAGSQLSSRHARNSAEEPIFEEKEATETESTPTTAVPTDIAAVMPGVNVLKTPTSHQTIPRTTSKDGASQASGFVLSAPPVARKSQVIVGQGVNEPQAPPTTSNLGVSSKALGIEGGVPPLTPLREMMEGAPDTSDEASSIALSQDGYSASEHGLNGHSPSVSASSSAYTQRDPSRSIRPHATSIPRHSPPMPKEQSKRPNHTPGSASGSSSVSNKLKPVRTSEESPTNAAGDKSQSFEQLIHSDQTIQYTLTPKNMRNIEGLPESPRFAAPPMVHNSQESSRPLTSRSHSSSVSKYTGFHANPTAETPKSTKSNKVSRPTPGPAANMGARLRPNAPQPRDARVERESMGDLAEFISSTAPPGSYEPVPPRTAPAESGYRGINGNARTFSGATARVGTANSLPRRAGSSAGRNRLQARDAVVSHGDSISDLIDFVRSGPQLEKEAHRIPRTVAPFRTTMDSDQMSGAVGGKAIDASLPDPRYSQATESMHSSINSQSALLSSSAKTNRPLPVQSRGKFDEEDMMPKRKQRKVPDMYQIDFSDEEEEYQAATHSRPKPVKEESLAEFLASVPPPPDSSPAPLYTAAPKPGKIKKKSSSTSIMSRFGRRDSGPHPPPKPKSSGHDTRSTGHPPQLPTHTPLAVQFSSSKPATYEPARGPGSDYVSQLDTARNKVVRKNYQPREAVYTTSRTNDLASFLRSEPPPSSSQPQTFTPTLQRDEASAFQRMFGRKKVH